MMARMTILDEMSEPKKVPLKCLCVGENIYTLRVDPVDGAIYRWQYCKSETADWRDIYTTKKEEYSTVINLMDEHGDKYRCLISVADKVRYYSEVLTV